MENRQINVRRNNANAVVLYDTDELITAKIENFKDLPATLTLIEHINGQWDMKECSLKYERKDARSSSSPSICLPMASRSSRCTSSAGTSARAWRTSPSSTSDRTSL